MLIYFFVTLAATLIGAVAGMGGGVIIKPILDMLGDYNVVTISILSSITVFSMALVSTIKQIRNGFQIEKSTITVTVGAVIGGILGGILFDIIKSLIENSLVTIVQSMILIVLLVFCLFYDRFNVKYIQSSLGQVSVGIFLGILGTFLGIGGGPINVALLCLVLGLSLRSAAKTSVFVILFAQVSGLIVKAINGQYQLAENYFMLLVMIPAAIIGGLIGAQFNITLLDNKIKAIYNSAVVLVILICLYNIISKLAL